MINDEYGSSEDELIKLTRLKADIEHVSHDRLIENLGGKIRIVTVEPLLLIYVVLLHLQVTVMSQYIYYRVGRDLNLTTNHHLAYVCDSIGNDSHEKEKTDHLQDVNASYIIYIQLSSCIFTAITAPFYCVFSDRFGRKVMFLLPGIGLFVKSVIEILIQIYDWPIYTFIITEGLYGLSGGFNFAKELCFSYIADISTRKLRTRRIAILGIMFATGSLFVSVISGVWIKASGYLIPYICSGGLSIMCVLYPIYLLKETPKGVNFNSRILSPKKQIQKLFTIYWNRPQLDRTLLIVVLVTFNFYYISEISGTSLASTYLMSFPICMNTIQLSIFGFINSFAINCGIAFTVIGLARFLADLSILLLCVLSGMSFTLQMAFATSHISAYTAAASNLLSFSAFPFIRGYLSKRVSPSEQGALFGGLVLSETICSAITRVIIIYFYKKTFLIFHGMVYLLITLFAVIAIVLTFISIAIDRKIKMKKEDIDVTQ